MNSSNWLGCLSQNSSTLRIKLKEEKYISDFKNSCNFSSTSQTFILSNKHKCIRFKNKILESSLKSEIANESNKSDRCNTS